MTLGLCMIVKDEEEVLARCLDSCADAFDEIVVADTGSSDGPKEIAKRYTDKVFDVTLRRRATPPFRARRATT